MNPPNACFQAHMEGSKLNLFFQNFDLKKSSLTCENYHYARAPRTAIMIFLFSHRAQGKWRSRLYALSKALIIFNFFTWIQPSETEVLPSARASNNVSIPIYCGAEVCGPESLHTSVLPTGISS